MKTHVASRLYDRCSFPERYRDADGKALRMADIIARSSYPAPALPCPEKFKDRFLNLPADPHVVKERFFRYLLKPSIVGTTWFTSDACLGSVSSDTCWVQRRPLIGHWKTEEDAAVCLRLRFLCDGKDLGVSVANAQKENRILSLIGRPAEFPGTAGIPDGHLWRASDLRVRYQLTGKGVRLEDAGQGVFVMKAGGWKAVIHTVGGQFNHEPVTWEAGTKDDEVTVDAVCYTGEEREFDFRTVQIAGLGAGLELIRTDENISEQSPVCKLKLFGGRVMKWRAGGGVNLARDVKMTALIIRILVTCFALWVTNTHPFAEFDPWAGRLIWIVTALMWLDYRQLKGKCGPF